MRIILFLVIFLTSLKFGNAQSMSRFDFFVGYGFYEGLNFGSEYFFKSYKNSASFSIGFDNFSKKNQESFSLGLAYNFAIFTDHVNAINDFKWHINNEIIAWKLEDGYYLWKVISIIPSVNRKFILTKNLKISFDMGPSFNIVLYNKRKTFNEIGWPYHVMPNYKVLLIF
jgi:hypothetical protein